MKEGIIYIKSGRCRYVDHFKGLTDGRLQVVPSIASAISMLQAVDRPLVFLFERRDTQTDVPNIHLLRSLFPSGGIVLLTRGLDPDDRKRYLQAGVNCALKPTAGEKEFWQTVRFLRNYAFKYRPVMKSGEFRPFRMPLWKRAFDIAVSSLALAALSPLLLLTAAAIRIESPGPVICRTKRVGTNYRIFDLLKFRSTRVDAPCRTTEPVRSSRPEPVYSEGEMFEESEIWELKETLFGITKGMLVSDDSIVSEQAYLQQQQEQAFAGMEKEDDSRATCVGRFIRRCGIDGLPQLVNILKGDMSVVGNRPLPLGEAERLTGDEYIDRFLSPSGLTGLWRVEKCGGAGSRSLEERRELDMRYARTMSWWLDMKIILRTLGALVRRTDADDRSGAHER